MDYLQISCNMRLILTEYSQEERTQQEKYSKIFTDFHRMLLTITKQGERPHPLLKLDYLYGRSHGTPQRIHRLQHHSDIFRLQTSLSLVHSPVMSILQSYLFSSSTMNITILREVIPISVIFWQFIISLIDFSEIGSSKISSTICAISYCRDIIIIDLILQYFSLPYWECCQVG